MRDLPKFDDLPGHDKLSRGCAWGLWDRDGVKDEFGTLNLLTPEIVAKAVNEATQGVSVSLNWSLAKPRVPVFKRGALKHQVIDNATKGSAGSYDDTVSFNTQSGSQWDGLRHVIHRGSGLFYNGFSPEEIINNNENTLGIDRWHSRGGIVGRGVLIDYVAYAARHGISYSATENHRIEYRELEEAAKDQGLVFQRGDILIIRSGLLKWYNECEDSELRDHFFAEPLKQSVGVRAGADTASWIWDHHFSAVAGDALAWESVPYPADTPSLHQYLISMWGTPIGELWDLESLALQCRKLGKYSFLFVSVPLNVPGGVASPPNAVAIF